MDGVVPTLGGIRGRVETPRTGATDALVMNHHCRIEVDGPLPAGLREEMSRRFGLVQVRQDGRRTVLSDLTLDQAGLRALLDLLWDAGARVRAVTTTEAGAGQD
ncbi:hypothetical protein GCM10010412_067470 [Nonomuraea recticatena]|uniref:Uncharacterized protein n=1 Tax=Nonomuraea recticatena TaxID=46178 RepID=A0ABP6F8A0_9ACTN